MLHQETSTSQHVSPVPSTQNHSMLSLNPTIIEKLQRFFAGEYDPRLFDAYIPPMGGDAEQTPEVNVYPICERLLEAIATSAHRSYVVQGDSGLGKTILSL